MSRGAAISLLLLLGVVGVIAIVVLRSSGPAPAPPAPPLAPTATAPRLVVGIVFDQLPAWVLERYAPHLDPEGAIRRAQAGGAAHTVRYPYAATLTAPGHVAIYSGATPFESGVSHNERWDRAARDFYATVDDRRTLVVGRSDAFATPEVNRAEVVADVLHRATEGRAVITSISGKDRGAVLPGGRHADAVLFFDSTLRAMTTSSFYGATVPAWASDWIARNNAGRVLARWEVAGGVDYAALLGADDRTGESEAHGLGRSFPHDPEGAPNPWKAWQILPGSTEYMLALAEAAIAALGAGADEVPDLVMISVSGTDYVGHHYGPDSWEYLDNLRRVDRAVGAFVDRLAARGPIAYVLTSDHGVAPLPERRREQGLPAGRIVTQDLLDGVSAAMARSLGAAASVTSPDGGPSPGRWVEAYETPYLYLSAGALEPARREQAVTEAVAALLATEGIAAAFDVRRGAALRASADPLERVAGASIPEDAPGDVFVVTAEGWIVDADRSAVGTTHGTWHAYDTDVPVLAWGTGVTRATSTEALEQRRVAATIAALLGVEPPPTARVAPVPGVRSAAAR